MVQAIIISNKRKKALALARGAFSERLILLYCNTTTNILPLQRNTFFENEPAGQYAQHLYANDLEGYLQLAHISNKGIQSSYITGTAAPKAFQEVKGKQDYYTTPNSYFIPKRASKNIRHFRALYIDLDLTDYSKNEAIYEVALLSGQGIIPEPTMIVDSGRGLHLYWRINHAPKQAIWTWQELEDHLYRQLKHLGADAKVTDSARLLRLPGTINSRNNAPCKPLVITDKQYSMYELRDQYLEAKQIKPKAVQHRLKLKPKQTVKGTISHLYTPYSLHKTRLDDLLTICELRNFDMMHYRNTTLHLYAYWQGITERDMEALKEEVEALNKKFREPLEPSEIKNMLKHVPAHRQAFVDQEPTPKGVTGYNYSNNKLIRILNITPNEQKHLKTIISTEEKYKRNNERRKQGRRNEAGLTLRQQQAQENLKAILTLREQGLTITQIAQELGLTAKGVEYYLYK